MTKKTNRKMISIKLPPELIETLRAEADLRGADLTAVIEERLREVSPLHDKLDRVLFYLAKVNR
jgi:hypothetical protein